MNAFESRLLTIRERMARACARVNRPPESVRLLPVTKTVEPERIREAAEAGLTVFGENRVQEARRKIPLCPSRLEWHLIGHLQTNKVRLAVSLFACIHSVDSLSLLKSLEEACARAGRRMPILLEVNVGGEASKFGFDPADLPGAVQAANACAHLEVVGLMTVPPFLPEPEQVRPFFRRLRLLRDETERRVGTPLPELSMGMSHDFETAIEEGATWVRIGTALFGPRPKAEEVPK